MILERSRLRRALDASSARRVTLLVAPPGFGKSRALDAYLQERGAEVLRFNVRRSHGSLARFARALAAAFEPSLPAMGRSLAIAHERATQSPTPSDVLATWLAEHLEGPPRTIVIDDLHNGESDRGIAAFVAGAIERSGAHVRWILATHSSVDFPLARWLSRGEASMPIDERILRLTNDEALTIAERMAPGMDPHDVLRLRDVTSGMPAAFTFGLRTIAQSSADAASLLDARGSAFDAFAEHVFSRFTPIERARLIESAMLPELDEALVASPDGFSPWFERIDATAPQIFETGDGRLHFHGLFLRWLRERLAERGSEAMRAATMRAAHALERVGRIDEVLALYIRERYHAGLVRLIETHGFAFMEAGRGESIREAIDALDPLAQMASAAVLALKAVWESKGGRFDTAESWFQLALDRAPGSQRAQIAYHYGSHLLRFFRSEAVDVFEQLAGGIDATDDLRAYALAALGPAYVFERRYDDARRVTDEALVLATDNGGAHVIAKVHFQASYVALYVGDAARAKRLASIALSLSDERGFFDIAAGALSVLYNVASDIEDDPVESLRLLEAVGDCAAKSGSLTNQLIALVAQLEIEIERNNERVAEQIDEKLQALDVSLAGRATFEALLPTQAMRASWSGDFLGAFRLLENSADQQWSADRKALRYAEIAFYAAGAGLEARASDAMRHANEALAKTPHVDLRVQRARLVLALAAIVLGRSETVVELFGLIDASSQHLSPRLLALRRALEALFERYRGLRNHDRVMVRLVELDEAGFAGIARTISMLPLSSNASRRAGLLTRTERAVLVRWADGTEPVPEPELEQLARKLDCAEGRAALRAVTWHRDAFEESRTR